MDWAKDEVNPKLNQYGGEHNTGSTHMLIEALDYVTETLEDNRADVTLSTIDFSKAFNRLQHDKCLQTFAAKGASTEVIRLLGAFLSGRQMTVRIGEHSSTPRAVNAGPAPHKGPFWAVIFLTLELMTWKTDLTVKPNRLRPTGKL